MKLIGRFLFSSILLFICNHHIPLLNNSLAIRDEVLISTYYHRDKLIRRKIKLCDCLSAPLISLFNAQFFELFVGCRFLGRNAENDIVTGMYYGIASGDDGLLAALNHYCERAGRHVYLAHHLIDPVVTFRYEHSHECDC